MERPPPVDPSGSPHTPPPRGFFTRRRVLVGLGGIAGAGVVASGGVLVADRMDRFGRQAERSIPDHRIPSSPLFPRMVIARGIDPVGNVRAALGALGGMDRFVAPEDIVVVKPNIGWDRTAAQGGNTHPDVVAEVVRLCREARARRVIVSDCPVRKSASAFARSGILAAASQAGAEVIVPEESRYYRVRISERLGVWDVLEPFVIATKIINVPIAKHHDLTGVTGGLKNWIGITGKLRLTFHGDLQASIAELAALMRPTLTVIDASRVLMANGPAGGSLDDVKPTQAIAAGLDPVALDSWALSLFPGQAVPASLRIAQTLGLGQMDFAALAPLEVQGG